MKKLVALVCAVIMLCTLTASALANPSINTLTPVEVNGDGFEAISIIKEDWDETVKGVVGDVNSSDKALTLKDIIDALMKLEINADKDYKAAVLTMQNPNGEGTISVDCNAGDLASPFSTVAPDADGGPVDIDLVYQQMKDRNANEFVLLVIDPLTGNFAFVEIPAEGFNAETGAFHVTLPFAGVIVLVER